MSPSTSPKCNSSQHTEGFQYDDAWLADRERRIASSSSPQYFRRLEHLGRHSSRKYRISPSANWLVRSKSMVDKSEDRLPYRKPEGNENHISNIHRQSSEEQFQLEIDELNRKMEDDRIWKLNEKSLEQNCNASSSPLFHGKLKVNQRNIDRIDPANSYQQSNNTLLEDGPQYGVQSLKPTSLNFSSGSSGFERIKNFPSTTQESCLDIATDQRVLNHFNFRLGDNSIKKSDDKSCDDKIEDQNGWRSDKRQPLNTSVYSSSPEPPPRINKRVSPLLARRIAYNSRLNRTQPSPGLPRRFPIPCQYGTNQNESTSSNLQSSSLPCSPILSYRNCSYEPRYLNDFSP